MYLEIYELDPAKPFSAPELRWKAALKNTKVKLDFLSNINMLLKAENGLRGGTCHSIYRYAKPNNKCMKYYDQNKESPYHQYLHVINLYGLAMCQKFPIHNFEWIKDTSQFNEDFTKKYNEKSDEGCSLWSWRSLLEKLHKLHNDLPFLPEEWRLKK